MTVREQLAFLLYEHERENNDDCACGWLHSEFGHADHVADVITTRYRLTEEVT